MSNEFRLSVDPGLGGTGYALWDTVHWSSLVPPVGVGVINAPNTLATWEHRSNTIANYFDDLMVVYKPEVTYIEYPKFFQTAVGHTSAAQGDVFKLTFLVGRLYQIVKLHNLIAELIPVNEWKGQMPKDAVAKRVANRLKGTEDMYPNHAMDAVGIGLYMKGYFRC